MYNEKQTLLSKVYNFSPGFTVYVTFEGLQTFRTIEVFRKKVQICNAVNTCSIHHTSFKIFFFGKT